MSKSTTTFRVSGGIELDEFDFNYASDLGYRAEHFHDVNAIRELQQFFEEAGSQEKADSLIDVINGVIESVSQDALSLTGFVISYNQDLYNGIGGWQNEDTGKFIGILNIPMNTKEQDYKDELKARVMQGWEEI